MKLSPLPCPTHVLLGRCGDTEEEQLLPPPSLKGAAARPLPTPSSPAGAAVSAGRSVLYHPPQLHPGPPPGAHRDSNSCHRALQPTGPLQPPRHPSATTTPRGGSGLAPGTAHAGLRQGSCAPARRSQSPAPLLGEAHPETQRFPPGGRTCGDCRAPVPSAS